MRAIENMLSVRDLVTSYGKVQALRGICLDAAEGEITCLLGPNGAGKTTTMFTIAGILSPESGSVVLSGDDITRLPASKVVSRGLALVPENRLVFPYMNVEENLHAGAYSRRASEAEVAADVADMYRRFPRLEERKGQLAGTLSGGEQQMLAIARGLMNRPKILLMDEPSIGLAPLIVREIFNIIRELNAEGVTIFLVEQNAHMALTVAHKFYLIENGEITFSGSPGELAEDEVIHRAYLGSQKD